MARSRKSGMGLGIVLLAHKMLATGINHIPPITYLLIIGQTILHMGIIDPPWDQYDVCLSGEVILRHKDYTRLFLSVIEHADDIHLYHNMASFLLKGRSLEARYGSKKFVILLCVLILASSSIYIGLAYIATEVTKDYYYMSQCAIGFSGVLFALKVLTTYYEGSSYQSIHGVRVPAKYAVWAELFIIHILVPKASFMGHFAGIMAGVAYIFGPLKLIVNAMDTFGSNHHTSSYTYLHNTINNEGYSYQGTWCACFWKVCVQEHF
ncbi:unnamed protein product, partial [Meganyctiphanes norvegica]